MGINFQSKPNSRKHSKEVEDLTIYLNKNKCFIKLTLKIISTIKETVETENINDFYQNIIDIFNSMENNNEELNTYSDLMYSIYKKQGEILNADRGDVLEAITANIILCENCKSQTRIIKEAQFYLNNNKISEKDIDVVFEHCGYDLLECKANITNYLCEPFEKISSKLKFMKDVKNLCERHTDKKVNVYFVTATVKVKYTKTFLEKNGYGDFQIIDLHNIVQLI